MASRWQCTPWAVVRVASLPSEVVDQIRVSGRPELAARVADLSGELRRHRDTVVEVTHSAVAGCVDRSLRRWLLAVKRDAFNGRTLAAATAPDESASPPAAVTNAITRLRQAERAHAQAEREFTRSFETELATVERNLTRLAQEETVATGLLLWNRDVASAALRLGDPNARESPRRHRRRLAAIARYVARAATRTTPFGHAAGAGLVGMDGEAGSIGDGDGWLGWPQVHAGNMLRWLDGRLAAGARGALPLRVAPVRSMHEAEQRLLVPHLAVDGARTSDDWTIREFARVAVSRPVWMALGHASGSPAEVLMNAAAAESDEGTAWQRAVEHLLDAGVLERVLPQPGVDAAGLARVAREVAWLGDTQTSKLLEQLADRLIAATSPGELRDLMDELLVAHGPEPKRPVVLSDLQVLGLRASDTGIDLTQLETDLAPALDLAHATFGTEHHDYMVNAFLAQFGTDGACEDVPGWLMDLLRTPGFVDGLRAIRVMPDWLTQPIGDAIREAQGARARLPYELFESLPRQSLPLNVAVFVQAHRGAEGYRLVLNGLQSGRNKYLSRYLGSPSTPPGVVHDLAAELESDGGALPVEIAPCLGMNTQLHPPLTSYAFEIPFEPATGHSRTLPLTDLRLTYDAGQRHLGLWSLTLRRWVEPVHLGFLRDIALPDELLLLRALSPRFGEDMLAEQVDLYNLLDFGDLLQGKDPPSHRARLEVNRLVLERERWALPMTIVPREEPGETAASYSRRLRRWREARGLPCRGFARIVSSDRPLDAVARPRFFLDWQSPFVSEWLHRRVAAERSADWLFVTEPLPHPGDAVLRIGEAAHMAELLVQIKRADRA